MFCPSKYFKISYLPVTLNAIFYMTIIPFSFRVHRKLAYPIANSKGGYICHKHKNGHIWYFVGVIWYYSMFWTGYVNYPNFLCKTYLCYTSIISILFSGSYIGEPGRQAWKHSNQKVTLIFVNEGRCFSSLKEKTGSGV